MKKVIEESKKEILTTRTVKPICDLCGEEGSGQYDGNTDSQWGYSEFTCVAHFFRDETGMDIESMLDICPGCFEQRLLPWLESQKIKPTV